MTFDEWEKKTIPLSVGEKEIAKAAYEAGKRDGAMLMQERCASMCNTLDMEAYGVYPMRVIQISNACAEAIRALENE